MISQSGSAITTSIWKPAKVFYSNKIILLGAITFDLTFPWWNVPHLLPVTFFWCVTWRKITFWPLCLNSIGTSFRKTSLSQVWSNFCRNYIRFCCEDFQFSNPKYIPKNYYFVWVLNLNWDLTGFLWNPMSIYWIVPFSIKKN